MRIKIGIMAGLCALLAFAVPNGQAFTKDSLVWKKCTACHEPTGGKISRVEEIRTTPEEWTVIVDRMARLHGMDLKKTEMDTLLKELCSTQILSPDELGKVSYLNLYNNPQTVEKASGAAEEKLFATCVRCHSGGKIYSYRMTRPAWAKLRDFHLYMDPAIVFQMREMHWNKEADTVLSSLASSHSYGSAWIAPKQSPAGSWLILGHEPGKGDYRGQATIKSLGNDEYAVEGSYTFADGSAEKIRGEATLYGGHALRTRTVQNGYRALGAFTLDNGVLKGEHHLPAPDYRTSASTWYPADGQAKLLKVSPAYLLAGETTTLTIEGVDLPRITAGDVRIGGSDVKILSAKSISDHAVEVQAVYRGKGFKKATIGLKGLNTLSLDLAAQIDHIAITPEIGRARISGGKNFPPEGVQFEAIAFAKGATTADIVRLGPVPAAFKLNEEKTRPTYDDLLWSGNIQKGGKYIPTGDYGPNPSREYQSENSGIVKVEAEYTRGGRQYLAKSRLVFTLPDFVPRIK